MEFSKNHQPLSQVCSKAHMVLWKVRFVEIVSSGDQGGGGHDGNCDSDL